MSVEGVDAAIEWARTYGEAGADVVFVEGLATDADISRAADELAEWPLAYASVEGKGPPLTPAQLGMLDDLATFEEFSAFMGADEAAELEQRFARPASH